MDKISTQDRFDEIQSKIKDLFYSDQSMKLILHEYDNETVIQVLRDSYPILNLWKLQNISENITKENIFAIGNMGHEPVLRMDFKKTKFR